MALLVLTASMSTLWHCARSVWQSRCPAPEPLPQQRQRCHCCRACPSGFTVQTASSTSVLFTRTLAGDAASHVGCRCAPLWAGRRARASGGAWTTRRSTAAQQLHRPVGRRTRATSTSVGATVVQRRTTTMPRPWMAASMPQQQPHPCTPWGQQPPLLLATTPQCSLGQWVLTLLQTTGINLLTRNSSLRRRAPWLPTTYTAHPGLTKTSTRARMNLQQQRWTPCALS